MEENILMHQILIADDMTGIRVRNVRKCHQTFCNKYCNHTNINNRNTQDIIHTDDLMIQFFLQIELELSATNLN